MQGSLHFFQRNKKIDHIRGMGYGRLIEMVDKGFRVLTLSSVYLSMFTLSSVYFIECLFYRDGVYVPVGQAEREFVAVVSAPGEEADVELLAGLQAQVHGERELLNTGPALLRLA